MLWPSRVGGVEYVVLVMRLDWGLVLVSASASGGLAREVTSVESSSGRAGEMSRGHVPGRLRVDGIFGTGGTSESIRGSAVRGGTDA